MSIFSFFLPYLFVEIQATAAQFSLFTLLYNIYTVYSNLGVYLTNKRKKEKKDNNGFNVEVYGGQRSLAFELTTAIFSLPADVLWGSFVTHSFLPHRCIMTRNT